ncbi:hypothetical protein ACPV4X_14825 [Vibrio owensii]|uniref:hypothetical protein n=1 Tax=Vibrio owensii TaxID=696485 RepID=UPI0040693F06
MRTYLVSVLGLVVALMAFGLSQASPSPKLSHAVSYTSSLIDGEAHLEKAPFSPSRKIAASLFSRNALRVNHSNTSPESDDFDVVPARWLTVVTDSNKRFVSKVAMPVIDVFYPRSKYRLGTGQESNLIYRFMHAR